MRRKWISTLLMLTIGVGLLSGCGKAADNNTTTEVTDATSNGEDGTVTLTEDEGRNLYAALKVIYGKE